MEFYDKRNCPLVLLLDLGNYSRNEQVALFGVMNFLKLRDNTRQLLFGELPRSLYSAY